MFADKLVVGDNYRQFSESRLKEAFGRQVIAFQTIVSDWLRQSLREIYGVPEAISALKRREYHVQTLFDLLTPTEEELAQFRSIYGMAEAVRKLLTKVETNDTEFDSGMHVGVV